MGANTAPIFSRAPSVGWNVAATANTTADLTSGTIYLIWTADTENGGRLATIKVRPLGTNVATVLRIWLNNGSVTGTAANNSLYYEKTMAATTVSQVAEQADTELAMALALPAGYRVYATIGTTVAAGLAVTGVGGAY